METRPLVIIQKVKKKNVLIAYFNRQHVLVKEKKVDLFLKMLE